MKKSRQAPAKALRPPSIGARFLAYLIDWYLSGVLLSLSIIIVHLSMDGSIRMDEHGFSLPESMPLSSSIILNMVSLSLLFAYFVMLPLCLSGSRKGCTAGGLVMKIRIVSKDRSEVSMKKLFIRNMILFLLLQQCFSSYSANLQYLLKMIFPLCAIRLLSASSCAVGGLSLLILFLSGGGNTLQDWMARGTFS